jgi:hypothetical protein
MILSVNTAIDLLYYQHKWFIIPVSMEVQMGEKYAPVLTGISLTQVEKDIVLEESKRTGINNVSATLRKIIREWYEFTGRKIEDLGNEGQ